MTDALIKKSKWFWAWNDDKEEAWLRQMAQQGLHLQKAAPLGEYQFVRGEPEDVVYRLDYIPTNKKDVHYFQLFRDAGWEHVGEMMGWQYWRKAVEDGHSPEIFTDAESKVQKYQRLLGWLIIFYPILFFNLTRMDLVERYDSILVTGVFILFLVIFLFYTYAVVRIFLRINSLKKRM